MSGSYLNIDVELLSDSLQSGCTRFDVVFLICFAVAVFGNLSFVSLCKHGATNTSRQEICVHTND